MDAETGRLTHQTDYTVERGPGPLAVDPRQRHLYAGLRGSKEIASFRIEPGTGGLTPLGRVSLPADPCFVGTDRTGRFLLSSYYGAGIAAVHPIRADGAVNDPPVAWIQRPEHAHSIQTDPSNRFVFVPHTVPPNQIDQFLFDAETGRLEPNAVPAFTPPVPEGPRHFCFHPHRDIVYVVNEQGGSVTAYHLDTTAGTLAPFATVPTLPEGYSGKNATAEIRIAPSGRFLYASNRGHDSIACFAIDASTGALSPLGQQPTEPNPRAFTLDPVGRFLLAAGQGTGKMAIYRIDERSGRLAPLEVYPVGKMPMWILIL
jgi:6-phosphogluconolactonase (cycloisomerase 2 family)